MRGIVSTYQGLRIRSLSIPFSHYALLLPIQLSRPTDLPRPDALFQLISTFSSLSISCGNSVTQPYETSIELSKHRHLENFI